MIPVLARALLPALMLLVLGGCATFSADGGFGSIEHTARDRLGAEARWARTETDRDGIERRVAELLQQPLSADNAVQLALLNNKGLQAAFFELGIAEADMVQATRLPNPGFSFARLDQGPGVEIDRGLQFHLARLLTLPVVRQIETRRFEQARAAAALSLMSLAVQTRKAWVQAVASEESLRYTRQVLAAAQAGADLARLQLQAGNWNKLQQAREQVFEADAALNLARAEQSRLLAREQLTRLLGLPRPQASLRLPERLPDLPAAPKELPDIEQAAMAQRFDVQAAKLGAEQLAKNLGLSRATRFVNVLDFDLVRNTYNDAVPQRGYEISVELPLFDWGDARVARAEAMYLQAVNRAAQTAVDARSEVRVAHANYRSSFEIARHYRDEIVPLRKRISEENLLRYNGMLIGVFELLADARAQIGSVNGYLEALRDFWLAQAELEMALVGPIGPIGTSAMPTSAAAPETGSAAH